MCTTYSLLGFKIRTSFFNISLFILSGKNGKPLWFSCNCLSYSASIWRSHVAKSCIFKNPNLRRKHDRNFRGKLLENHFRHQELYSKPQGWLARSRYHLGNLRKTLKILMFIFLTEPLCQVFTTGNFVTKED